jgi:tetratricopeptide (TPR) repeat protein
MAWVLLMQWFTKKAIKFYKKALDRKPNDSEIIEILSELTFEIKNYTKSLEYTILYLKNKPRDPNKLAIKGFCLEKLWDKEKALLQYKKVLDVQPYNTEIKNRIRKIWDKLKKKK